MSAKPFPIVIVGHVDHGKSTLIGRILHDTGSLPEGRIAELKAVSAQRGLDLEWSFLLDALQVERDQGITVDTTRIWFRTEKRPYMIIDAPGHREFLRNMVTGASGAEAAVLLADAERGAGEQTRRHAFLLSLLGIKRVVVAVNKMDLVGHAEAAWAKARDEIQSYLERIGISALHFVPLSARHGDNIASRSASMPWWQGPTLLDSLDELETAGNSRQLPLRLPVQDVYRIEGRRVAVGRIESGGLRVGERVTLSPSGQTATVAALEGWRPTSRDEAWAGQSVAIRFREDVVIARGQIIAPVGSPARTVDRLTVRGFWLDREVLSEGDRLLLRIGTAEHAAKVERIDRVVDIQTLDETDAREVGQGGIAELSLRAASPVALDLHHEVPASGRAALIRDGRIVGGCIVIDAEAAARSERGPIVAFSGDRGLRSDPRPGLHKGGVVWLTGLSGAGKSTLATAARASLADWGWQVAVLDGDALRLGLNSDLGFSPEDRHENVRRAAEVAKLMADTGQIVLVSLITPTNALRDLARRIVGDDFLEVWVKAEIDTCAERDPKGLYRMAVAGEIAAFTGVSAPFETPEKADRVIATDHEAPTLSASRLIEAVRETFGASDAIVGAGDVRPLQIAANT